MSITVMSKKLSSSTYENIQVSKSWKTSVFHISRKVNLTSAFLKVSAVVEHPNDHSFAVDLAEVGDYFVQEHVFAGNRTVKVHVNIIQMG